MVGDPPEAVVIQVRVTTGARGSPRAVWHGEHLAVWLNVIPEKGRANKALQVMLAELFGVAPAAVRIIKGATSRTKLISIVAPRRWPPGCPDHRPARSA